MTRRQLITGLGAAGGLATFSSCDHPGTESRAQSSAKTAPLRAPKFYWGVGIENCWMAQTDPAKDGSRRRLDVFEQMQHYKNWKADLDQAADVGVKAIRYGVPWYKAEPKPGVYDWSWIDKPIEYLVNTLKIIPIMDLIHYGTPTWMPDGVADERFPEALAAYAGAMAGHFKGLVNHYSPHNEPQLTCVFCGLVGRWPPYQKNIESWARIGVQVAKGMVLETEAIRSALSDSVILSVDPFLYGHVEKFLPRLDDPNQQRALERDAAAYPATLAYRKVPAGSPMFQFLTAQGVKPGEIEWFEKRAALPDIFGTNYYPDIFAFGKDGDFTRKGALPLDRAAREAVDLTKKTVVDAHQWSRLPVYLTETSAGLKTEAKVAFLNGLYDMARELKAEKVPIVGINWWPLFNTIQWDYREKTDKPLVDFIYPGGWNNGLYVIEPQSNGDLKRVRTAAADAYRDVIHRKI